MTQDRLERDGRLMWVRLSEMRVAPCITNREKLSESKVETIARKFDPDAFDTPAINLRDGIYWLVNGWHRTEAAKRALGPEQEVQCWVRRDLTDAQAAKWFLDLNNVRQVSALDKFYNSLTAGEPDACDIDRIVRAHGLFIGSGSGKINCVKTLHRVYERGGAGCLARTLELILSSYGDAGCEAAVIDGLSLLINRYSALFDLEFAAKRLSNAPGGVNGLLGLAHQAKKKLGMQMPQCIAGAAVDIMNRGGGGKKLPSWWKQS